MSDKKPPGDETVRGLPAFVKDDPNVTLPGKPFDTDSYAARDPKLEVLQAVGAVAAVARNTSTEAAREVSQGAWRDRVFAPRGVVSRDELLEGLTQGLRATEGRAARLAELYGFLRQGWLPLLRQAVEQAGGDGFDAWLGFILKPPAPQGVDVLVIELAAGFERLRQAQIPADFFREGWNMIDAVRRALESGRPRRLSFKVLERELEGKLEVHELLLILFLGESELRLRVGEVSSALESLKAQLKASPGAKPDGLYSNYGRLKSELRVLEAEVRRRQR
jgi:hypothetical protein